jgi:hypothetical protein
VLAAVCWALWLARNNLCFEKKRINNPSEIIYSACTFMDYWSGLYPDDTQVLNKKGVQVMIQAVVKILGKSRERQGQKLLLLTETEEDKEESEDGDQEDA